MLAINNRSASGTTSVHRAQQRQLAGEHSTVMGETLPLWGSAKVGSSTVRNLRLARPADCQGRGYNGLQGTPLNGLPGSGLQWTARVGRVTAPASALRHGSAWRHPSAWRCLCRQNVSLTQGVTPPPHPAQKLLPPKKVSPT